MKSYIALFTMLISPVVFAKTYTEEEFIKKVNEEVKRKLKQLRINLFQSSRRNF